MTPEQMRSATESMRRATAAIDRGRAAIEHATFAMLDLATDLTPVEDRAPVSWEIERERFLRGLPAFTDDSRDS